MDPVSSSFKPLAAWLSFSVILSFIVSSSSSAFNFFLRYERQARCILLKIIQRKHLLKIIQRKHLLRFTHFFRNIYWMYKRQNYQTLKFTNSKSLCISRYLVPSLIGSIDNFLGEKLIWASCSGELEKSNSTYVRMSAR